MKISAGNLELCYVDIPICRLLLELRFNPMQQSVLD
jgi:hypothetical protein